MWPTEHVAVFVGLYGCEAQIGCASAISKRMVNFFAPPFDPPLHVTNTIAVNANYPECIPDICIILFALKQLALPCTSM